MSDAAKVLEIVLDGFAKEQKDEEMLIRIVTEGGIQFRHANKMFRICVEENGLRISGKKRAESIEGILQDNEFGIKDDGTEFTFADVQTMCERIAVGNKEAGLEAVSDTTTQQAMKAIKKFLKSMEIEFPKAPKKVKGGLRLRFLEHAAQNPAITDAELAGWYVGNTKDKSEEDVQKWMNKYSATINHGRAIAQFCIDNSVSPAPVSVEETDEVAEAAGTED